MEPLFLQPVFQDKIWGGKKLAEVFGYDLPSAKVGECWGISAHPHGPSIVKNGPYAGLTLAEVWQKAPSLFGNPHEEVFPLLVKILDAEDDLSVQVHPDDTYGKTHAGELGKTECWYIIDAEPGATIVYGHHAKTKEEFAKMVAAGDWQHLLRKIPVKKGDFYYVPAGTIHAIGKGILILETQQSSDTTYRVYDYDRKDEKGHTRELHIQESLDVATIPHHDPTLHISEKNSGTSRVTQFVDTPFFAVYEWQVAGLLNLKKTAPYTLASVIAGVGQLEILNADGIVAATYSLNKGDHFILPAEIQSWRLGGDLKIIASTPGKSVQ